MRFIAPPRGALPAELFDQPALAGLACDRDLLATPAWPTMAELNARLAPARHAITCLPLEFADPAVLDVRENYERRIFARGLIATRRDNWHDLFNALVWKRFPRIKSALNTVQVGDMGDGDARVRTRRQCACTQFDEAGAVLVLRDPDLLPLWDAHDWTALFHSRRSAWRSGELGLHMIGHALFEHALNPAMLLVSKTLAVIDVDGLLDASGVDALVADAIIARTCLGDPQDLRPLPLSGIPGWHRADQDENFYREQPCFRPVRPGRRYPAPLAALSSATAG